MQLDGAGLVQADRHRQAARQQRLFWQRRGNRFFVSDAVLETAEDRPRAQHQLQLLDRVQGVGTLDSQEDIIKWPAGIGDGRPRRPDRLAADLAGHHHADAATRDRLDVLLTPHQGDLAAGLSQTGAEQRADRPGTEEEEAERWRRRGTLGHHCVVIFSSRPRASRSMFVRCRISTRPARVIPRMITGQPTGRHADQPMRWSTIKLTKPTATALNEASDATCVSRMIRNQVTRARTSATGASASSTPPEVATPLPPLKPRQRGQLCPMTAASPIDARAISLSPRPSRMPAMTGMKPFSPSATRVRVNAPVPPARKTLAAPMLPLPSLRRSWLR